MKFGEFPAGDPELHHVAGSIYANGKVLRLSVKNSSNSCDRR